MYIYFEFYSMSHTELSLNTGTCGSRYRDFGKNAATSATDIFLYVYNYFIDWSTAFIRVFNLLKSIK